MCPEPRIAVEICYARAEDQVVIALDVADGATVADAIAFSGITIRYPETRGAPTGIFGSLVSPQTVLRDGDRIEIYRALATDPGQARRGRVARAR